MDEIRPWLYIGKLRETLNIAYLRAKSIQAMLHLAEDVEHPGIISLYLPVNDFAPVSSQHFKQGVTFIREQKSIGNRVLIACGAGINRSSTFCVAALKEEEKLRVLDAFKEVKKRHPESMPHKPVWESLCSHYKEKVPYIEIMRIHS